MCHSAEIAELIYLASWPGMLESAEAMQPSDRRKGSRIIEKQRPFLTLANRSADATTAMG